MTTIKKICVIGLGYIGLPTAAMFAARKCTVIGVDVNAHVVDTVNQGKIHIVEPDLDMIVHAAVTEGYLKASTVPESADAFLIAVPTPFKEGFVPDLGYIEAASRALAPVLQKGSVVILESTSPVGTTEKMTDWLKEARPDLTFPDPAAPDAPADIHIAYCPERVLPGQVVHELVSNDRIIGGITPACAEKAADIYRIFAKGSLHISNARTAEMAKLTENAFRDVNIAFANELSVICDKQGINVWELIRLANHHPRVNILQPGCGVGGHCIAVDPWFIVHETPDEAKLIRTAREVNDSKPAWVMAQIRKGIEAALKQKTGSEEKDLTIACFGLAFKPDIDDLRESPALKITMQLATEFKGRVIAVEPNICALPDKIANQNIHLRSTEDALTDADVIVLLVDHAPFRNIPADTLAHKNVIDAKGIWR